MAPRARDIIIAKSCPELPNIPHNLRGTEMVVRYLVLLRLTCCLSDLSPHIRPSRRATCKYFLQVNEIFPSWQHQHQILIIKHPVTLERAGEERRGEERSHRKFWTSTTPVRTRLATNVFSGAETRGEHHIPLWSQSSLMQ